MMTSEEIYSKYHNKVHNFIYGKVSNYHVAEDLTSKVFIKVIEKLDTFDENKAAISTWIYTIASNTVIDYYRVNHVSEEINEETAFMEEEIDKSLLCNEILEELAGALDELTDRERELIVLHYYHDETLKNIAVKMNMSYANVKVIHAKALKKLRDLIPECVD